MTIKQTLVDQSGNIGTCLSSVTFVSCVTQLIDKYASALNLMIAILTVTATITFYVLNYLLRRRDVRARERELLELRRKNDIAERAALRPMRRSNGIVR